MMLELRDIFLSRGDKRILDGVSIEVEEGSFFVLMGPTGCGKTTLIRVAGLLDRFDSGSIHFGGSPVPAGRKGRLETRRMMATVFQEPVMFTGSVFSNIAWGLQLRGLDRVEISSRVTSILEMVGLHEFAGRDASTLSGGETRVVALARAMVLEPRLLLLDEPTTSLDPSLRQDLLERIGEIQANSRTTFLMATHDLTDALAVGITGAVMREGRIEQSGRLEDILFSPRNRFMASFTGMRNMFPAEFLGSEARVGDVIIKHTCEKSGHGYLAVPPEVIVVSLSSTVTSERNRFAGEVVSIRRNGVTWDVEISVSAMILVATVTKGALDELGISPGSTVHLSFKASAVHVF